MTRALFIPALTLLTVATAGAAATARPSPAHVTASCSDANLQPYPGNLTRVAKALVCEINVRRSAAGLVPLTQADQLDQSSQFHTDDMAESHFVAHEEAGHPSLLTRIRRTGYFKRVAGGLYSENIAVAPQEEATAAQVVEAWLLSDEHRAKILYDRFREVGVGGRIVGPDPVFYPDRPSVIYTTDFGRRYWRRCGFRRAAGSSQRRLRACTHRGTR